VVDNNDHRILETVRCRALYAAANLTTAKSRQFALAERFPDDREVHWLLGHTLRRLGDSTAAAHLALAGALDH
jgi:Flp pilus assembly protein TadD